MKDFQATESIQYIVDRRRFDVDSDHDPDHKPIFTDMGKEEIFWLLFAAVPVRLVLSFSSASYVS